MWAVHACSEGVIGHHLEGIKAGRESADGGGWDSACREGRERGGRERRGMSRRRKCRGEMPRGRGVCQERQGRAEIAGRDAGSVICEGMGSEMGI